MTSQGMSSSEDSEPEYAPQPGAIMESSSDEEVQPTLTSTLQKRPRTMTPSTLVPVAATHNHHNTSHMPQPGYWGPSPWMQSPWMPPPPMQAQPWHPGGGPPSGPYHNPWPGSSIVDGSLSLESEGRASRRRKRHQSDTEVATRNMEGKKPHQLVVKAGGEIDPTCDGKNAWDNAVRVNTPRILDMSVVNWEAQNPASVALLRETLEKDFEYVGHTLSVHGFRSAIKKYMKAERARLKMKFVAGKNDCPVTIDPLQWKKLQDYWKTELQVAKTANMQYARAQVKDYSAMGRKGRAGKELAMRKGKEHSLGLTEIADGMSEMQENGTNIEGASSAIHAKLIALEKKQNKMEANHKDIEGKITQMLLNQSENTNSMEEVKNMLKKCMERFSSAEGFSPSIGISTVETQVQLDSSKQEMIPIRSNTLMKTPTPMVSMHVTASSDNSDVLKDDVPSKIKEDTLLLKDQPTKDTFQLDAGALIDDLSPSIDPMPMVLEEGISGAIGKVPQSSIGDPKPRTRRLKKVVERIEEDPPSPKKAASSLVAMELSPSKNPQIPPKILRTSPRKQKLLLKASTEGNAVEEENSIKVSHGGVQVHISHSQIKQDMLEASYSLHDVATVLTSFSNQTKAGKRVAKGKAPPNPKSQAQKFVLHQEVFLLNPKNVKQSVAAGVISGVGGQHKFHFVPISDSCYKVDVNEAIWPQVSLMFPNLIDKQVKIKDVIGTCALWEGKFLKVAK